MNTLEQFTEILCGHFDNQEQFDYETQNGQPNYPLAKHVNTLCNNKIANLPDSFDGKFVLEESYYTLNGATRSEPRLFLFTEQGSDILLTSYDLPKSLDKTSLNYDNMPMIEFSDLIPSEKFTPATFRNENGTWVGGSESMFTPALKFTLKEQFSKEKLVVSEVMESNGKRTFGFDPPIEYKRI